MGVFIGGVGSVKVQVAGGDFAESPLLTATLFAQEGNTWPVPEPITDQLSNQQQGPTGERTAFSVRMLNVEATEVTAVRAKGYALELCDVEFTSKDGKIKMVVKNVIPRILTAPIADFGRYGFVLFEGEGTAAGDTLTYTVTETSS